MKKILSILTLFIILICPGCMFKHTDTIGSMPWGEISDTLKKVSPECRKVLLVETPLTHAYEDIKNGDYSKGLLNICISYAYYQMDYTDINLILESPSSEYFTKTLSKVTDTCVDVVYENGDSASLFFYSEATDTLKPYIEKHFDKCSKSNF